MRKERFEYLYEKYLKGDCTSEEFEEIKVYFASLEGRETIIKTPDELNEFIVGDIKLDDKRSESIFLSIVDSDNKNVVSFWKRNLLLIVAAASVLLISLSWLYYYKQNQFEPIRYTNKTDAIKTLKLSDQSLIYLQPGATLIQLSPFNKADSIRKIELVGEGFFAVAKNPNQPFVLVANDKMTVRVLGTRFNANFSNENCAVVLTEGSILVDAAKEKYLLKPEDKINLDLQTNVISLQKVDTLLYNSWIEGNLYFKDVDVDSVIDKLQQAYPTTKFHKSIKSKQLKFTGYLPSYDLHRAVDILEKTFENHNLSIIEN